MQPDLWIEDEKDEQEDNRENEEEETAKIQR